MTRAVPADQNRFAIHHMGFAIGHNCLLFITTPCYPYIKLRTGPFPSYYCRAISRSKNGILNHQNPVYEKDHLFIPFSSMRHKPAQL